MQQVNPDFRPVATTVKYRQAFSWMIYDFCADLCNIRRGLTVCWLKAVSGGYYRLYIHTLRVGVPKTKAQTAEQAVEACGAPERGCYRYACALL